ncbi:hypothetical protein J437_LFUL014308 [Ladona fulva]|uniref:TELO2-interacting protein 2 n=1 Tax=Ladona fulva TaxID=123851 RepID=A0A8K0P7J9_LADFU|nr:hypothetical protein J437_LFUL014308 [Ladona fulva]
MGFLLMLLLPYRNMNEDDEIMENSSYGDKNFLSPSFWCNLRKVSDISHTKKLPDSHECAPTELDFHDDIISTEKNLDHLQCRLTKLLDLNPFINASMLDSNVRSFIISLLVVCGEQSSKEVWTSEHSVKVMTDIHRMLCQIFLVDIENMFVEFESKWNFCVCKLLLSSLKIKLQSKSWKQHPAAFKCYRWILFSMKEEQMCENIEDVLPPTLVAIDDYEMNNQILGIECLSHIMTNITRTDLCSLGYDDVIFSALEHLLYTKEPELIEKLVPCLTQFLEKVEKGYTKKEDHLQCSRYDKALKIILSNMELEQYLTKRKAYIRVLPMYLDSMGLPMLRWSKQLLRIFEDYVFVDDGSGGISTKMAIEALKVFILHTWPAIPNKMDKVLELLLKILLEVTELDSSIVMSKEASEEILNLVEECLGLAIKASPLTAKELCAGMQDSFKNENFNSVVKRVLC